MTTPGARRRDAPSATHRPSPAAAAPHPPRSPTSRSSRSRTSGPSRPRPARQGAQGRPGRHQQPLRRRSSWSRARPTRSWRRSASSARPTRAASSSPTTRRPSPRTSPRTASGSRSCAPTRSGRRSGRSPGATTALFGVDRVKDLADWPLTARLPAPAAARRLRPGGHLDALRRRRHHARPRRLPDRSRSKGADFPFDGGTAEITGRCKDCSPFGWDLPYTKRTGNEGVVPRPHRGRRHRDRQLREPGPEQPAVPRLGAPSSRPTRGSSTAWPTPGSTTSRSPTTTSATPARPASSRRSRTSRSAASPYSGAGKDLDGGAQAGHPRGGRDEGRDPRLRRDRRRLPRDRRRGSAAPACRPRRSRPTWPRRAQGRRRPRHRLPALGHRVRPDAVRRPAEAGPR